MMLGAYVSFDKSGENQNFLLVVYMMLLQLSLIINYVG